MRVPCGLAAVVAAAGIAVGNLSAPGSPDLRGTDDTVFDSAFSEFLRVPIARGETDS